jgi:hypothetical protein
VPDFSFTRNDETIVIFTFSNGGDLEAVLIETNRIGDTKCNLCCSSQIFGKGASKYRESSCQLTYSGSQKSWAALKIALIN